MVGLHKTNLCFAFLQDSMMDPLTMVPMTNPVVLSSGYVMDRTTVLHPDGRLRLQYCPFTREILEPKVYPLVFMALKIKQWRVKQLQHSIEIAELLIERGHTDYAEEGFCCCVAAVIHAL